ncbi:MAG: SEC-C domain-containing protein, partial [Myxococcaceae bacterium]|nr:SEC-C domain-containing protein [Myxococcaceae bacterium]
MQVGRNDPCPCGSGLKFKKCCANRPPIGYSDAERTSARTKVLDFVADHLAREDDEAFEHFWSGLDDVGDDLDADPYFAAMSEQIFDDWAVYDLELEGGDLMVDRFLAAKTGLTAGERNYLGLMKSSSLRLYEVEDLAPGDSLTLRDLIEGDRVTVQEKSASRSLHRFDWIATRVVARGASGRPELEGVMHVAPMRREVFRDLVRKTRADFLQAHPGADVSRCYKAMVPDVHELWARSALEPAIPQLANTDGEEMVVTRVQFDVLDRAALVAALDGSSLTRARGDLWRWSGTNAGGGSVSLGLVTLTPEVLQVETNSVARGARGRELLEQLAGAAVKHRGTTHEDMQVLLRDELKKGGQGPEPDPGVPPAVQEALVLDFTSKHYREWLDLPVPALDDLTPRAASTKASMRARLVELMKDLDGMYQRALEVGAPAFDPSWMWDELGLTEDAPRHPPPLAFERLLKDVPGLRSAVEATADAARAAASSQTVLSAEAVRVTLELQRALRADPGAALLAAWLPRLVNYELHRRKAFWVDEALAYMLASTNLDVRADELRAPFAAFALAFTDRHVLSMGERLLARRDSCPVKGRYLRALTVFVTEFGQGDERRLDVCFAFDALGADLPVMEALTVPLHGDEPVDAWLDSVAPLAVEDALALTNPLRGLLQVTLNAVLYAASAGVEAEPRPAPAKTTGSPRLRGGSPVVFSSDQVFFLPGAIEISQVRSLQHL